MWRSLAFSLVLMAGAAPATLAQPKLELSPFAGVRTAGGFRGEDQLVTFTLGSDATFGALVDYTLVGHAALEFLWAHQGSTVVQQTATVGDQPPTPDEDLFDTNVDYLHGGIRYDSGNEKYTPYVAGGLGVSRFSPDAADASSLTKFSFSVGAGINAYLTDRIGVRFDARAFGTRTGERREELACGAFGCVSFERDSTFWQSHFIGAVIIRF